MTSWSMWAPTWQPPCHKGTNVGAEDAAAAAAAGGAVNEADGVASEVHGAGGVASEVQGTGAAGGMDEMGGAGGMDGMGGAGGVEVAAAAAVEVALMGPRGRRRLLLRGGWSRHATPRSADDHEGAGAPARCRPSPLPPRHLCLPGPQSRRLCPLAPPLP